jgi:hypothetical protein
LEVPVAQRTRNGLLLFIQDDDVRKMYEEFFCDRGWTLWSSGTIEDALRGFGQLGDELGLVVCDDIQRPGPGTSHDREGVNLLLQRETHMFVKDIPFALFAFEGVPGVINWANDRGGLVVRMPYAGRVVGLMDILDQIERDHSRTT